VFGVHRISLLAACGTCSVASDQPVRRVDRSQSTLQSRTQPFHPAARRAGAAHTAAGMYPDRRGSALRWRPGTRCSDLLVFGQHRVGAVSGW
jgi:hypothetical protein